MALTGRRPRGAPVIASTGLICFANMTGTLHGSGQACPAVYVKKLMNILRARAGAQRFSNETIRAAGR